MLVNLEVCVKQRPGIEAGRWRGSTTLLGLYSGLQREDMVLPSRPHQPARIVLYQRNIEKLCASEAQLTEEIGLTMRHEIGHHFGFDDSRLRRLGH